MVVWPAMTAPDGLAEIKLATRKTLMRAFGALEPHVPANVKIKARQTLPRGVVRYIDPGWHRRGIGGMWELLGELQFTYLVDHGLEPHHRLLDVGCGALRGGWRFIEYLDQGGYYGIDKKKYLFEAGRDLELRPRGLLEKEPVLAELENFEFGTLRQTFDFALAQSVFTHLTINQIIRCVVEMERVLVPGGKFYATYYENLTGARNIDDIEQKPGLFTHFDRDFFHYDFSTFEWIVQGTKMQVVNMGGWNNPRNQQMLEFTRQPD